MLGPAGPLQHRGIEIIILWRMTVSNPRTCRILAGLTIVLCVPASVFSQANANALTNTSDSTLAAVLAFGTLTPGTSNGPSSMQAQFRLRNKHGTGYRLDAVATFTPATTAPVAGGATISAGDIGVGITSITAASGVLQPRSDVIAAGFNYDPSAVTATNGLTPFTGAASGMGTLADLATSTKILSGNRIDNTIALNPTDFLTVTMTFAVLPQYFTPATFSAIVTLTLSNGP